MNKIQGIACLASFLLTTPCSPAQGLLWSTCFGGVGIDAVEWSWDTLTVARNGDVLVSGYTTSPLLFGRTRLGPQDGFIARLRPNGTYVWTVRIGGGGPDGVRAILEEANGDLLVGGFTNGPGPLPATAGTFQTTFGGAGTVGYGDGFVARLTNAVVGPPAIGWLTYLGGAGDESVVSLARHPSGLVVAGGWTERWRASSIFSS